MTEPKPELLHYMSALRRGLTRSELRPVSQELQRVGYRMAEADVEIDTEAQELLRQRDIFASQKDVSGQETGLAYLGFDNDDNLQSAALSWNLGKVTAVKTFGNHVESLIQRTVGALGPPSAILLDALEGLSSNGESDVVLAQAFWQGSRSPELETSKYRGSEGSQQFNNLLKRNPDAATLLLSADRYADGASLYATFRPFLSA
jgi:hypothetical protein